MEVLMGQSVRNGGLTPDFTIVPTIRGCFMGYFMGSPTRAPNFQTNPHLKIWRCWVQCVRVKRKTLGPEMVYTWTEMNQVWDLSGFCGSLGRPQQLVHTKLWKYISYATWWIKHIWDAKEIARHLYFAQQPVLKSLEFVEGTTGTVFGW